MARRADYCLLLLFAIAQACVPREPPERPPPPPLPTAPILQEEEIEAKERPELVITAINEERMAGQDSVTITGTILNRGNGAARDLAVTVTTVDSHGAALLSVPAIPNTTVIPPASTATFRATFVRPPTADQYHVEAVSR